MHHISTTARALVSVFVSLAIVGLFAWGFASPQTGPTTQLPPGSTVGLIGFVGYVVDDVAEGSPAAKADIRKNDIVAYLDKKPVRTLESITDTFATTPPGTTIEVKFIRYDPERRKNTGHSVTLVTEPRKAPSEIKWIYRQSQ